VSEPTKTQFLTREEQIKELIDFSGDLAAAVRHQKNGKQESTITVDDLLFAECTVCNLRVPGDELFKVGEPPDSSEASAPVKRLRLGYCAHVGCESYIYRISFRDGAGVDWTMAFQHIKELSDARKQAMAGGAEVERRKVAVNRRKYAGRLLLGAGIILILLAIRQWYLGGRIPFLREPEKFHVGTSQGASQSPDPGD